MDKWTGERMNRTLKETSIKQYYYDSHKPLKEQGLTSYELITKSWQNEPERFKIRSTPSHSGTKQLQAIKSIRKNYR